MVYFIGLCPSCIPLLIVFFLLLGLFSTVGDVETLLHHLMFATPDDSFINGTTVKTFTTVSHGEWFNTDGEWFNTGVV